MGKKLFRLLIHSITLLLFVSFLLLTIHYFNFAILIEQVKNLTKSPLTLIVITVSYLLAFILRAIGWKLYLHKEVPIRVYLSALFYSLFFNHLFPFKVGEVVRIGVIAQYKDVRLDQSIHSVFVMRLLDLFVLGVFSAVGALWLGILLDYTFVVYSLIFCIGSGSLLMLVLSRIKVPFIHKHIMIFKEIILTTRGLVIFSLVVISWLLEAVVIFGVVQAAGQHINIFQAIWINSLTVASSIFQFAPGGFATYESVMSFALVQFHVDWDQAFHLSLITHGYKYLFSFIAGLVAYLLFPLTWPIIKSWFTKKGAAK